MSPPQCGIERLKAMAPFSLDQFPFNKKISSPPARAFSMMRGPCLCWIPLHTSTRVNSYQKSSQHSLSIGVLAAFGRSNPSIEKPACQMLLAGSLRSTLSKHKADCSFPFNLAKHLTDPDFPHKIYRNFCPKSNGGNGKPITRQSAGRHYLVPHAMGGACSDEQRSYLIIPRFLLACG